jgi:dTDP-4-amino-4,6-dideoxygalactose transaminase
VLRLSDAAHVTRDEVIQRLSDAGIGTSALRAAAPQPYWRDRYGLAEKFPHAEQAYRRMFSIPLFTAMSDDEQGRVIAALRAILG